MSRHPLHRTCCRLLSLLAVAAVVLGGIASAAEFDHPVTVRLQSGRVMSAKLDVRSDQSQLLLRWEGPASLILRPVQWDRVVAAEADERRMSVEAFRAWALDICQRWRESGVPPPAGPVYVARDEPGRAATASYAVPEARSGDARVRSLAMDASAANFNGDPEVDGLYLAVLPRDERGQAVAVDGTLEVELYGLRTGTTSQGNPSLLGRWTRLVRAGDFGPAGSVHRLEFQGVDPARSKDLAPKGAVRARLSVPGQGVFEATLPDVRLRPYSATRDWLEQIGGSRYLPGEPSSR